MSVYAYVKEAELKKFGGRVERVRESYPDIDSDGNEITVEYIEELAFFGDTGERCCGASLHEDVICVYGAPKAFQKWADEVGLHYWLEY